MSREREPKYRLVIVDTRPDGQNRKLTYRMVSKHNLTPLVEVLLVNGMSSSILITLEKESD